MRISYSSNFTVVCEIFQTFTNNRSAKISRNFAKFFIIMKILRNLVKWLRMSWHSSWTDHGVLSCGITYLNRKPKLMEVYLLKPRLIESHLNSTWKHADIQCYSAHHFYGSPVPSTEATSLDWKISVFGKSQCSAMACRWEIEDILSWNFRKTVLVIRNIKTAINYFLRTFRT
jgi:hypothetical protein